jgi:hypothetical protein
MSAAHVFRAIVDSEHPAADVDIGTRSCTACTARTRASASAAWTGPPRGAAGRPGAGSSPDPIS